MAGGKRQPTREIAKAIDLPCARSFRARVSTG
jgi:hypothetical protein